MYFEFPSALRSDLTVKLHVKKKNLSRTESSDFMSPLFLSFLEKLISGNNVNTNEKQKSSKNFPIHLFFLMISSLVIIVLSYAANGKNLQRNFLEKISYSSATDIQKKKVTEMNSFPSCSSSIPSHHRTRRLLPAMKYCSISDALTINIISSAERLHSAFIIVILKYTL